MNKMKLLLAALVCLGVGSTALAGDAAAGKTKSAVCAACHGADGNSPANPLWPKLAGQHESYVVKQLQAFKNGERKDPTMAPMAMPLSDEDMADLAAYFAGQNKSIGSTDADKLELGEKIYKGGLADRKIAACMACHGPSGAGNPASVYPSVNGQHAAYVSKSLKDFRSGTRTTDPAGMMRDVVKFMSDAEIEAVSSYIQGLN